MPNIAPEQPDVRQVLKFKEEPALIKELVETPRPNIAEPPYQDPVEPEQNYYPNEPVSERETTVSAFDHLPI